MRWKIIPFNRKHEYSEEIKEFAHAAALKAALDMSIEFVDDAGCGVSALGQKWKIYFSHAYGVLRRKCGDQVDDLILFADRIDKYASVYEASLRQRSAELSEENVKQSDATPASIEICGALLAQHYNVACKKELLVGTSLNGFPGTGDLLAALSVNRIMQAALFIGVDFTKVMDLLSDAMAAKFLHTQGEMHVEHFYALKNDRKVIAKKVAASGGAGKSAKLEALKAETISKYKAGKWDSVPLAAQAIAPEIVELSKKNGPALLPTTTKPLEWIRAYRKTLKTTAC
jgi:hypothetical protein